MNGQLSHLIKVINSSNKALKDMDAAYSEDPYINSVRFEKRSEKNLFNKLLNKKGIDIVANSVLEWQEYLKQNNCIKVYAELGVKEDDRNLSAYANGVSGQVLICKYKGYFEVWRNSFNYNGKDWDVKYQLIFKDKMDYETKTFDLHSDFNELIEAYKKLGIFAKEIDEEHWSNFFMKGKESLEKMYKNSQYDIDSLIKNIQWPFGGMGSWNDSPPYSAHRHNRESEYELLSNNLYTKLHLVIEEILNLSL